MAKEIRISERITMIKGKVCPMKIWVPILENEEIKRTIHSVVRLIDKSMVGEFLFTKNQIAYRLHDKDKSVRVYLVAFIEEDFVRILKKPELVVRILH